MLKKKIHKIKLDRQNLSLIFISQTRVVKKIYKEKILIMITLIQEKLFTNRIQNLV